MVLGWNKMFVNNIFFIKEIILLFFMIKYFFNFIFVINFMNEYDLLILLKIIIYKIYV